MKKDIFKPAAVLFLVTLVAAAIIGGTYAVTEEPIRTQRAHAELAAIMALLPAAYEIEYIDIDAPGSSLTRLASAFDQNDNLLGYVFSALPAGYSGRIHMLVALNPQGVVQGVRILNHTETPGLGANVTQDWFLGAFAGRTSVVQIGDLPVIASSTVSINAVLRGVNDAIAYFSEGVLPHE
jgi:electron transport complex protein RnfG